MRKKIIICSNILWTITQFRLGLIKALMHAGYEVICIADVDDFSILSEKKIAKVGASFIKLPMNRKGINPVLDFVYFLKLCKIFKIEKPDVVFNYTIKPIIYGSIAANLLNIPSFAITTGLGYVFSRNNILTKFVRLLYRYSLRFPKKIFFLNKDDAEVFIQSKIVDKIKTVLLPGEGIDTTYYCPEKESSANQTVTFLLFGRLLWEKGVGEYVEAAKQIKLNLHLNVKFQLVGYIDQDNPGGIKREQIQKWEDNGIINYLGITEDIIPLISGVDCVVLPSYYREGVPRSLLEAASMAKPIITADSVGCKEVVDDKLTGLICQPRNTNDLLEKMLFMINLTSAERIRMGKNGRMKMISEFEETIVIKMYFEELKKFLPPDH